jgi:hypothetical protein
MYFFLIFEIKYVKHLCNSCSENSRFIFMTHISQVNDYELIIIFLNTSWVLHPLIFKYRDLYRYSIIQFPYFFNVAIISIFCQVLSFTSTLTTILTLTPTVHCLGIECASIYVIRLPRFNQTVWIRSQQMSHFFFFCFANRKIYVLQPCCEMKLMLFHN